jgi:polysaccharide biosynthesis/export protein
VPGAGSGCYQFELIIKDHSMKFFSSVLILAASFYLFSCAPQKRIPNYLQNVDSTGVNNSIIPQELRIQKNDLLSIQVFSASIDPAADAPYNLPSALSVSQSAASSGGFLVDANGNIEYPKLGTFRAEGLTKVELAAAIKKRLTEPVLLLKDPVVIIRFMNLKITIMGEVNNQGVVTIPGEKVTILEAIGLAGGITDYGLKDGIKVIREIDGKREIGKIDLSSKELFDSPYYNLQQNDVVLVDPTPKKAKRTEQDLVMQRVQFGLTIITAAALILNVFQ